MKQTHMMFKMYLFAILAKSLLCKQNPDKNTKKIIKTSYFYLPMRGFLFYTCLLQAFFLKLKTVTAFENITGIR